MNFAELSECVNKFSLQKLTTTVAGSHQASNWLAKVRAAQNLPGRDRADNVQFEVKVS
jgi:hypothetical protein